MNIQSQPDSIPSHMQSTDLVDEELKGVITKLKEARKILARDWEQMTPRERSAVSRIVKELEQQEQALREEIEMSDSQ